MEPLLPVVTAGLVPAIHAYPLPTLPRIAGEGREGVRKTWMPAKTESPPRDAAGCLCAGVTPGRCFNLIGTMLIGSIRASNIFGKSLDQPHPALSLAKYCKDTIAAVQK